MVQQTVCTLATLFVVGSWTCCCRGQHPSSTSLVPGLQNQLPTKLFSPESLFPRPSISTSSTGWKPSFPGVLSASKKTRFSTRRPTHVVKASSTWDRMIQNNRPNDAFLKKQLTFNFDQLKVKYSKFERVMHEYSSLFQPPPEVKERTEEENEVENNIQEKEGNVGWFNPGNAIHTVQHQARLIRGEIKALMDLIALQCQKLLQSVAPLDCETQLASFRQPDSAWTRFETLVSPQAELKHFFLAYQKSLHQWKVATSSALEGKVLETNVATDKQIDEADNVQKEENSRKRVQKGEENLARRGMNYFDVRRLGRSVAEIDAFIQANYPPGLTTNETSWEHFKARKEFQSHLTQCLSAHVEHHRFFMQHEEAFIRNQTDELLSLQKDAKKKVNLKGDEDGKKRLVRLRATLAQHLEAFHRHAHELHRLCVEEYHYDFFPLVSTQTEQPQQERKSYRVPFGRSFLSTKQALCEPFLQEWNEFYSSKHSS